MTDPPFDAVDRLVAAMTVEVRCGHPGLPPELYATLADRADAERVAANNRGAPPWPR